MEFDIGFNLGLMMGSKNILHYDMLVVGGYVEEIEPNICKKLKESGFQKIAKGWFKKTEKYNREKLREKLEEILPFNWDDEEVPEPW